MTINTSIVTQQQMSHIRSAIQSRKCILIAGDCGAEQQAMLLMIAKEAAKAFPQERVALFCTQDAEVNGDLDNMLYYRELSEVTTALRQSVSSLFASDLSGVNAESVINAWGKGHFGGAVVPGATVEQAVSYLKEVDQSGDVICGALNLFVLMEKSPDGARIKDIIVI